MPFPLIMLMQGNGTQVPGESFNWAIPATPEPSFEISPNGVINTSGKTILTFGAGSSLDDILVMTKQSDQVTWEEINGIYYYTIPSSGILFYPTGGSSTEMSSPYLVKYLTDGIHTVGNKTVYGSDLIAAGFNVKTFSGGINVSELNSLGFLSGDLCYFRFYHIVGGIGHVTIDTFK